MRLYYNKVGKYSLIVIFVKILYPYLYKDTKHVNTISFFTLVNFPWYLLGKPSLDYNACNYYLINTK